MKAEGDMEAALRLLQAARLRARAQAMAKKELSKRYPAEYADLYAKYKEALVGQPATRVSRRAGPTQDR